MDFPRRSPASIYHFRLAAQTAAFPHKQERFGGPIPELLYSTLVSIGTIWK